MRTIDNPIAGDCFVFDGESFHHICVTPETIIELIRENKMLREWKEKALLVHQNLDMDIDAVCWPNATGEQHAANELNKG